MPHDIVEASTGAWWRTWRLLVWKGACLAVMLALLLVYLHRKRAKRDSTPGAPEPDDEPE